MEEKYINLLLKTCLKLKKGMPLFINYNKVNKDFVDKVYSAAEKMGIKDIYRLEIDSNYEHKILTELNEEEIKKHDLFNSSIWDEYAKKDAAFLMLDAYIPNLMDDVDSKKLALATYLKRKTKPIYSEKQLKSLIPWCIAAVPNESWAKDIFKNSENPLKEFWKVLSDICMLNTNDPSKSWQEFLKKQEETMKKLNDLHIQKLHYKNSLGTDLTVELFQKALWQGASSSDFIVNMPSYEVFTTPDYTKTEGIVYSSKPLIYNGKTIDNFYIKFKEGKVCEYKAEEGEDILGAIIKSDEYCSFLGEVALVNFDSPISNSKILFKSTLFDENAACHLALGSGFLECIDGGNNLDENDLKTLGLNPSKNHVDFMIGTNDLLIEAECYNGNKVTIMKDGNIII